MGTQTPWRAAGGNTHYHLWRLHEVVQSKLSSAATGVPAEEQAATVPPFNIEPHTHPHLHAASWALLVYSYWWLGKTSLLYRYVLSDSLDLLSGVLYYFFIIPAVGNRALARLAAPFAKKAISGQLAGTGVCEEAAPYMTEHFRRLCEALEAHFIALTEQQRRPPHEGEEAATEVDGEPQSPAAVYLLGTPHPTLADVALASTFSSIFLIDDPPASWLLPSCPTLVDYVAHVTGWQDSSVGSGGVLPPPLSADGVPPAEWGAPYQDVLPPTLLPVLELVEEVMPFLVSQVASLRALMSGPDFLKLQKLKGVRGESWGEECSSSTGSDGTPFQSAAYVLPPLTPVESLMMIDDVILTVKARAFDLELALLAGKAVVEATSGTGHSPSGSAASIASTGATSRFALTHTSPTLPAAAPVQQLPQQDVVDPEDADYHHTFTKSMLKRRKIITGGLTMARRDSEATQMEAVLGRVVTHMQNLHFPHYTLTTIPLKRRYISILIPEHDAARVREEKELQKREQ